LIADHCVALDHHDMELLAARGVEVIHNPESNMKLASGLRPSPDFWNWSERRAGNDGCASNNDLDLFGEMDTCAKLHKAATLDPTVLPAATVLRMATRNGAKALGLESKIGEISPGKWADVIVVALDQPT